MLTLYPVTWLTQLLVLNFFYRFHGMFYVDNQVIWEQIQFLSPFFNPLAFYAFCCFPALAWTFRIASLPVPGLRGRALSHSRFSPGECRFSVVAGNLPTQVKLQVLSSLLLVADATPMQFSKALLRYLSFLSLPTTQGLVWCPTSGSLMWSAVLEQLPSTELRDDPGASNTELEGPFSLERGICPAGSGPAVCFLFHCPEGGILSVQHLTLTGSSTHRS